MSEDIYKYRVPNEYHPELLNIISVVPYVRANTSTRMGMTSSQLSQTLIPKGASMPRMQTGLLREFGQYTFKLEMPATGEVLNVINMYPAGVGVGKIKENPIKHLIYRDVERNEIEYLELPTYHLLDKKFGFRYKYKINPYNLIGKIVEKGTVFADTPAKLDNGEWCIGMDLNEVLGSFPAVTEDGCVISKTTSEMSTFTSFDKYIGRIRKETIPRNLYGTSTRFQAFPNVGEYVNEDGLLMAFFQYDPVTAPVELTAEALMEVDYFYDETIYLQREVERAKVIDIRVYKEGNANNILPFGMEEQLEMYIQHSATSYKQIHDDYRKQINNKRAGVTPRVGKRLQMNVLGKHFINERSPGKDGKIVRTYSQAPIDGYMIVFTLECETKPTFGNKFSGMHGDKTIVCDVWPDERMPMDEDGNRAHILRDDASIVKRQNPGLVFEGMVNASARDFVRNLRQSVGLGRRVKVEKKERAFISTLPDEEIVRLWELYMEFLADLFPMMYDAFNDPRFTKLNIRDCLAELLIQGPYLISPPNDPVSLDRIMELCNTKYMSTYGPLQYIDAKGRVNVTRKPSSVVNRYYILLDKIASEVAAVASARLNHFGCPIRISNEDRYKTPIPESPIRLFAEYEHHMAGGIIGGRALADINDQSNNPLAHREIMLNIINADKPTAIPDALDRRKVKLGNARPMQMIRHIKEGAGIGIYRMDDEWNWNLIQTRLREEYK